MKKLRNLAALALCMLLLLTACSSGPDVRHVTIEVEDFGTIKAEIDMKQAPITAKNFMKLVEDGFYDGLIFHRIIEGFMIQGGGFDTDYNQKEAETIKGEFEENGVKNDMGHTRGVLSMARTQVMDSASSQFFIVQEDSPHLDGKYAAFGKVTEGMDVVDKIAAVETDVNGLPTEKPVVITSIKADD